MDDRHQIPRCRPWSLMHHSKIETPGNASNTSYFNLSYLITRLLSQHFTSRCLDHPMLMRTPVFDFGPVELGIRELLCSCFKGGTGFTTQCALFQAQLLINLHMGETTIIYNHSFGKLGKCHSPGSRLKSMLADERWSLVSSVQQFKSGSQYHGMCG